MARPKDSGVADVALSYVIGVLFYFIIVFMDTSKLV